MSATTVADIFLTWQAAELPAIDVERLTWPELVALTAAAHALRPFAATSTSAQRFATAATRVRAVLTATPLDPVHPAVCLAELSRDLDIFLVEHPAHTLHPLAERLFDSAGALRASQSPLVSWFADTLSGYGEDRDGRPEAVVVATRRGLIEPIAMWLDEQELTCVDVATPGELRTRRPYVAMLLAGHPALAFTSAWKDRDVAAREFGWLLTAPPARHVQLALQSDSPVLDEAELWPLPADAHIGVLPTHAAMGSPSATAIAWDFPAPTRPVPRLAVAASGADGDDLQAAATLTASEYSIFFHPQFGPRPHLVAVDDETTAVTLSSARVADLRPGMLLAVRADAAGHAQIVERADAWLTARRGWTPAQISRARAAVTALKVALRQARAQVGIQGLQRHLTQGGIEEGYARVLLNNPLDDYYIAPRGRSAFLALLAVLGATELGDQFDSLTAVRVAHRQAGEQIRQELLALLGGAAWAQDVDTDGWTVLYAGGLGALLLTVITASSDEQVTVPRTWLGVPIDPAGHRAFALRVNSAMP